MMILLGTFSDTYQHLPLWEVLIFLYDERNRQMVLISASMVVKVIEQILKNGNANCCSKIILRIRVTKYMNLFSV